MALTRTETERLRVYVVGPAPSVGPFDIPFPFYDADEVKVYVGNVLTPGVTITQLTPGGTAGNTVTLDLPVSNTTVSIVSAVGAERSTGDSFVQVELSKEIDRIFARLQEIGQRGFFVLPDNVSIDVGNRRLSNVLPPILPTDVATKAYADVNITAGVGVINAARDAAVVAIDGEEAAAILAVENAETAALAAINPLVTQAQENADATAADRLQTAADRVQTGLDAAATAADRVQTGLDRAAAQAAAAEAAGYVPTVATQAEAQAGTDNTKLMTPLRSRQADEAFRNANALGWGQTWQAPTRAKGTVYQNTTGRPIQVAIWGENYNFEVSLDNSVWETLVSSGSAGYDRSTFAIVPNGVYYRATNIGPGTLTWKELR